MSDGGKAPPVKRSSSDTQFVTSLERGFRVLKAFDDNHPTLGVTEIAALTGMDKSAAQRFSSTLCELGYLDKDSVTRRYKPARRLMELSYTYLRHSALAAVAMPHLIAAGKKYNSTVNLAERIDTEIIYTIRIPNQKSPYIATVPGRRGPLYCTSPGLAIMSKMSDAEIEDILQRSEFKSFTPKTMNSKEEIMHAIQRTRDQGFAIAVEQLLPREIAIAAPIVNQQGKVIGAVQMPVYKPMWTLAEARRKLVPIVVETADSISGSRLHFL